MDLSTESPAPEANTEATEADPYPWIPAAKPRGDLHVVEDTEPAAPPTIGTRTLASLPDGPPDPQLIPPFLSPDGVTIFYGPGGVGKGMLCVYLAKRLVEAGHTVMIIDYEL